MKSAKLYLFTVEYPYGESEVFLEKEIQYLSDEFDKIVIYPQVRSSGFMRLVPHNVEVGSFELLKQGVKTKKVITRNWKIILGWWLSELIKSPHRFKYLKEFSWNFNRFIGLLDAAERLYRDVESNVVFYTYWFNEWATVLAFTKDLGLKGKFITRAHGYDFDEGQLLRGYHPFRYTEILRFDSVVQVSEYGYKYLQERMKSAKNIYISRLGVERQALGPMNMEDKYKIVSCSNFVPLKRIPLIAETLGKLDVNYHWTHFGNGPEMDAVKRQVLKLVPAEKMNFHGYIINNELMEHYKRTGVDLFINMSKLEGIPVSMMEAISFGIPVIGCNVCGIPELVNESTGCLLECEVDTEVAAERIAEILKFKSRDKKFRLGVKAFMEERFYAKSNFPDFITKYLKS